MHEVPVPSAVWGTPYFLISYPHTEHIGQRNDKGSEREPDHWVIKFYSDLCRHVEELTDVPAGTRAGVLDRDFWVEDDWRAGLPAALATCRVLVPLYSPRYFHSEACGREWYVFATRAAGQGAGLTQTPAIVPVLWSPTPPESVHEAARGVAVEYHGLGSYARYGLDGIMKKASYQADYDKVVSGVAQRIVAAGQRTAERPYPVPDFDTLPNAFTPEAALKPGTARLLITVVAPRRGNLLHGRDERYYGPAPRDWAPYFPASAQPIANYAANYARSLGYRPHVSDLGERAKHLLGDGPASHPELLIIDPWSVLRPECRRLLARLDLANKPWVQVVIPWNQADDETAAAGDRLRQALKAALRHKLERGRAASEIAVDGVPSIEDFGTVLPLLVHAAGNRYLGHAPASPPDGPLVEKPQLGGLASDPQSPLERTGV